jgi:hypothetical protein
VAASRPAITSSGSTSTYSASSCTRGWRTVCVVICLTPPSMRSASSCALQGTCTDQAVFRPWRLSSPRTGGSQKTKIACPGRGGQLRPAGRPTRPGQDPQAGRRGAVVPAGQPSRRRANRANSSFRAAWSWSSRQRRTSVSVSARGGKVEPGWLARRRLRSHECSSCWPERWASRSPAPDPSLLDDARTISSRSRRPPR